MGACGVSCSYPGKTLEDAKRAFSLDQTAALYDHGHNGYSGSIGELDRFTTSGVVFDTLEDYRETWQLMDKNHGLWARVRVIRETKPLIAARRAMYAMRDEAELASGLTCVGNRGRVKDGKGGYREGTPAQLKRVLDRYARLETKYRAILAEQVRKSTKTTWYIGGWASS